MIGSLLFRLAMLCRAVAVVALEVSAFTFERADAFAVEWAASVA